MSDYNTMTAQQCADWLAERDGCKFEHSPRGGFWVKRAADATIVWAGDHPYPLTLDGAAAALREPWRLANLEISGFGHVVASIRTRKHDYWKFIEGPDRMTAEYRAAVAARMEDDK